VTNACISHCSADVGQGEKILRKGDQAPVVQGGECCVREMRTLFFVRCGCEPVYKGQCVGVSTHRELRSLVGRERGGVSI